MHHPRRTGHHHPSCTGRVDRRGAAVLVLRRAVTVPPLRLLIGLAVSVALVAVAMRPVAANEPDPEAEPLRVLVIGDSVLLGAAHRLPAACENCEVVVDAAESRSTMTSVQAAEAHEGPFDVVIALLGHNDATNTSAVRAGFDELFDHYALVPRIVVLTLHEVRPGYAELNDHLRAAATERPNVTVADWNETVAARPDATASDDLHLNSSGVDLLTDLIGAEIDDARQPAEPPQDWTWEPDADEIAPGDAADPDAAIDATLEEFWDQNPPVPLEAVPDEVGGPGARPVLFGVIGLVIVVLGAGAVVETRRRRGGGLPRPPGPSRIGATAGNRPNRPVGSSDAETGARIRPDRSRR